MSGFAALCCPSHQSLDSPFLCFVSISAIIERYMVEDIAEGYRLTSVPHKRPEFYSQSTLAFLRTLPRPGDTVLSSSSFKVRKLSAGKKADEHSTAARHRSSTTAYVDEGGERSGHQPTSKHLSQSSLVSKNKLVSSKSVSSPLSGYSTAQSQSTAESLEAGIRKRFGNHSSLDYPPGAEEAAMELDTVAAVDRDVSGQQYGRRVERPNRRGGYLNKYSKYPSEWLKKDLTRNNLRNFHSLLINQGEKSKKWKVHWFSLNQRDQQLFYFSNEKKTKEKGLIDLSYGFYYPLDDSFFNRSFCFQIIIHSFPTHHSAGHHPNNITYYLHADESKSFTERTESIRPFCNPVQLPTARAQ